MIPKGALVVLDTNILVHLIRQSTVGARVEADLGLSARTERPLVSFVTVGELHSLALKFGWGRKKSRRLDDLIGQLVVVNIHQGEIVDHYAVIDHYSEKGAKPARPMGKNDVWIAATTAALSAYLVTTDGDFDHLAPTHLRCVRVDPKTGASRLL